MASRSKGKSSRKQSPGLQELRASPGRKKNAAAEDLVSAMERALEEGSACDERLTELAESDIAPILLPSAVEEDEGEAQEGESEDDEEEESTQGGGRGRSSGVPNRARN